MPEMARRALDGHQPPPVSASSPYVTDPPGFGLLCAGAFAETVADAPGAVVTRNAVPLASANATAPQRVRNRVEKPAEFMSSDPPGLAHPKVTGRYPNRPWSTPARRMRA